MRQTKERALHAGHASELPQKKGQHNENNSHKAKTYLCRKNL